MREPFIFLRSDITREYARVLTDWLRDEEATQYLNEHPGIADNVEYAMNHCVLPELTYLFSRGGRFYIICTGDQTPVGFVRLTAGKEETEMVVMIGEREKWGRKLGYSAIRECMRVAFFELRSKKLVAKIHRNNERSIRAFLGARFRLESETLLSKRFVITLEEYLHLSHEGLFTPDIICVTQTDCLRLKSLISAYGEAWRDKLVGELCEEIGRAKIVSAQQIEGDVVTMRSRVVLQLDGEKHEVSLVYPEEADITLNKLSVLSPVGTAILGYSEGHRITWRVPKGDANIHIEKILYQPESAGDYHL